MKKSIFKTYIVIINYKSWNDTIECLESVLKLDDQNFQIVLVDNSPTKEAVDQITSWAKGDIKEIETSFQELVYPLEPKPLDFVSIEENELNIEIFDKKKLILVRALENKGFSAGNNVGLKYINRVANKEDKIWLLNNDTVVSKNTLTKLIEVTENKSKVGVIGAKLLEYYEPMYIQAIGGNYNSWLGKISLVDNGIIDRDRNYNEVASKFDYPIGASMFLDVKFVRDVGLMEEKYFLYFEEYDWVLRGNIKGYESAFCPEAIIYHKGGGSSGGGTSKMVDFYGIRSKILFTKKFFPYKLPLLYFSFFIFIANRIIRKQYDRIPMVFKLIANPNLRFNEADHK